MEPRSKSKVMSLRLDAKTYRRLHAYGVSKDLTDSAAARELIAGGLAADGLALYSTELGAYLRHVVQPLLDQLDRTLEERNAEQEDRIARVVHRATRRYRRRRDREGHLRGPLGGERVGHLRRIRQAGAPHAGGPQPPGGAREALPWQVVAACS